MTQYNTGRMEVIGGITWRHNIDVQRESVQISFFLKTALLPCNHSVFHVPY